MKKKYIIVSMLCILIMMVGVSFAYFTSNINVNKKEMNVSSKRLAIIFTYTKTIVEEEIMRRK